MAYSLIAFLLLSKVADFTRQDRPTKGLDPVSCIPLPDKKEIKNGGRKKESLVNRKERKRHTPVSAVTSALYNTVPGFPSKLDVLSCGFSS